MKKLTVTKAITILFPVLGIFLQAHVNEMQGAIFADFTTFQDGTDPEFANGQLGGVSFTLRCTRRVDGQGSGIGNGGIVPGGTTNGTSTIFNSTNFTPPLAAGDNVVLGGASDFRLTFAQPVTDLTLHLYQLADNTLSFTQNGTPATFSLLSSDGDLSVLNGATSIRGKCACGDDGGDNASGSIFFAGTFTELSWTSDSANVGDGYFLQMSVRTTSVEQACPCEGPVSGGIWKNHGQYVSCVAKAAEAALLGGLIDGDQKDAIVEEAAESTCGKK